MPLLLTDAGDTKTVLSGEIEAGDSLFALRGNDVVTGSRDSETMFGGKDNDQLFGEGGNDELNGNNGEDLVAGGAGNDVVRGGKDNDVVIGGAGDDTVWGDRGEDVLTGNAGADTFALIVDSTLPPGSDGDLIMDFNAAEGDRIGLVGLTAADIVLTPRDPGLGVGLDLIPLFPHGIDPIIIGTLAGINPNAVVNPETGRIEAIQISTTSGQIIASIANATEADILSSIVTL